MITISHLLTHTIPAPTIRLEWGMDMTQDQVKKLTNKEVTALLYENDRPVFIIFWSEVGWRQKNWREHLETYPEHATVNL